jgi:hypothetical protein
MSLGMETSTTSTEQDIAWWPTPTVTDGIAYQGKARKAMKGRHAMGLKDAVAQGVSRKSISSPEASLASPSPTPASAGASRTSAGSGPSSPVSLASYDPATSSWRTYQDSWLDTEGWGESLATWPPSGMTRNGTAFQLPPSVPRTSATASGSWHTPTASDADGKPRWDHRASPGYVRKKPVPNLMAQIQERALLPTPMARDYKDSTNMAHTSPKGRSRKDHLIVAAQYWPTPQAEDNRDRGNLSMPAIQRRLAKGKQLMLSMVVSEVSGALNPTWVEWLMGFPLGWTDCEHLATRSYRKSSK